ncbi:predicted protein [Phaeodactylum tricornutum CCAP 1055/1]|jgi:hypothetical protein|uniref:Uncharacterized protein n=1 Tax=Phaeodactylum tricornutum (strain CCAP 1055/1) TaxID=556484 RepID=B7GCA7_PHATC|nr:predicted protein [Phaeodactylum tricornutum CCAP 1055/1]EEC43828.1 predicted protein [Phaeodactylum tricornutum CCAP 1055/1]|eukprot:XP_002184769.1 predicted protein [Phaeodactylum tricornutum CCAP 1055/1]
MSLSTEFSAYLLQVTSHGASPLLPTSTKPTVTSTLRRRLDELLPVPDLSSTDLLLPQDDDFLAEHKPLDEILEQHERFGQAPSTAPTVVNDDTDKENRNPVFPEAREDIESGALDTWNSGIAVHVVAIGWLILSAAFMF